MITKLWWVPKKPFFTIAFFAWLLLVTYLCLSSLSGVDTSSYSFKIPNADKIVHFVFYFTAAILGVFFLREQEKWQFKLKNALVIIFCFAVVYGIIIEVLQHSFTTNREADVFDVLANSFGGLIGVLISKYLFSNKGFLQWSNNQF